MKQRARNWICFAITLCLCLSLFCLKAPGAAAETEIGKVLIQTGNGGTTPVVWMELQYFPTNTSTNGVSIQSAVWYSSGGQPVVDRFEDKNPVYLVVQVTADEGYVFQDSVMAFINGSEASCVRESDTSLRITSHIYTPEVWAAAVYKHPTGETVEPGGWASFVTAGGYVQDFEWCLMTPDKQHRFSLAEAREEATVVSREPLIPKDFVDVKTDGDFAESLIMRNIPADLNGYYVYCRLYSYQRLSWSNTNPALITVTQPETPPEPSPEASPEPSAEPSPEPSEEPSPSPDAEASPSPSAEPSPSPSAEPSPSPSPSPEPEEHKHSPAKDWSWDENSHWHTCKDCDELLDKGEHELTWTQSRAPALGAPGEEKGVCEICGYTATRVIPALEPEQTPTPNPRTGPIDGTLGMSPETFQTVVLGILGASGIGLVGLLIGGIVSAGKNRRRHR